VVLIAAQKTSHNTVAFNSSSQPTVACVRVRTQILAQGTQTTAVGVLTLGSQDHSITLNAQITAERQVP